MSEGFLATKTKPPRRIGRALVTGALLAAGLLGLWGWNKWREALPASLRQQARQAAARGRWQEAASLAARRIELDPHDGEAWLLQARAAHEQHNLAESARILAAVPEDCPQKEEALRALVELQMGPQNAPLAAEQTLRQMLDRDPLSEFAHQRLIFFYAITLQRQKMVRQIRRAMQLQREPIEAYTYLFFADELDFTNGAEVNRRWLAGDPNSELFRVAEAFNIAKALAGGAPRDELEVVQRIRRMADGLERVMAELLQRYPRNLELLAWHVERAIERGDLDGTVEHLARLPPEADLDNRFWRFSGWAKARLGFQGEALADYDHALQLHPLDWSTRNLKAGLRRAQQEFDDVDKLQQLVTTARELARAVKVLPDGRSVPASLLARLADFAMECGDELYATSLRRRLIRTSDPGASRKEGSHAGTSTAASQATSFPLAPVSRSPYLNTGPDAHYVGAQACERCHPDTHQSYHETTMSRSMAEVDAALEPPDGEFRHALSGRRYQIYRQGRELRQRELLTGVADVGDVVLNDQALKYVVGSGHFSRTYLSEVDGFLVEAPATWFASGAGWDMSPGYDRPFPDGFERAATENCLLCHAGQIERLDGTLHQFRVPEPAIGCERCHGPGSLHIERWISGVRTAGEPRRAADGSIDWTIVNPANLPRELAEAVCQQCHLTSAAQVPARGRKLREFRPGLPLQDFFMSFRSKAAGESMTVVGHFDQLVLSRCYQKSGTLTCLTCHNPHDNPGPDEKPAYYRAICLECHDQEECRADVTTRAENDCTKCHMPGAATEIVHLAFTHHRIGVHTDRPPANHNHEPRTFELEPWHDLSRLTEVEMQRSLGLAYFDRSRDSGAHSEFCLERARELLEGVRARGLQEGLISAALAQILLPTAAQQAVQYASEALEDGNLPAASRIEALFVLATDHYRNRRYARAIELLRESTRLRRCADDWALLGFCQLALDDSRAALAAFEKAAAINPRLPPVHRELGRLYQAAGELEKARGHREITARLREIAEGAARGTRPPAQTLAPP